MARLSRPGWLWLNTKMVYPRTVTHPRTNWARRRATTLIKTNALPVSQTATKDKSYRQVLDLFAGMEVWSSIWRVLASLNMTSNDCGKIWNQLKTTLLNPIRLFRYVTSTLPLLNCVVILYVFSNNGIMLFLIYFLNFYFITHTGDSHRSIAFIRVSLCMRLGLTTR